jgi:hypothetical protein
MRAVSSLDEIVELALQVLQGGLEERRIGAQGRALANSVRGWDTA